MWCLPTLLIVLSRASQFHLTAVRRSFRLQEMRGRDASNYDSVDRE